MSIMPSNISLENYKHTISDITVTANNFDEPIIIRKEFLQSLIFMNDYDGNIAPRVQLVCQIEKSNYDKILTNMKSLTVTFDIYQIYVGSVTDTSYNNEEKTEQEHPWKSFTLKAMNANELTTNEINQLYPENEKYVQEDYVDSQQTASLTLYLYDKDTIQKSKISKYFILKGSKNDVLYRFVKDRNMENILMTPTDNTGDLYVIPYGSLKDNLKSLNKYYGIYNTPYVFFMDFGCTYLIEKKTVGSTLRKNEHPIVTIYLDKESDAGYSQSGSFVDNDRGMYILNSTGMNISDNDSDIDYAMGGTLKTVISGSGKIKVDKIGDYDVERTIVVDNDKHHSQLIYNINEAKRNITMNFRNIDIGIITPNKKYVIIPDDTYYKSSYNISGNYRLSSSIILFKRSSESELVSSVAITLNKIPD